MLVKQIQLSASLVDVGDRGGLDTSGAKSLDQATIRRIFGALEPLICLFVNSVRLPLSPGIVQLKSHPHRYLADYMDAEELAKATGLCLSEAEALLRDSIPMDTDPTPTPPSSADVSSKQDADVEFLQACFPHIPIGVIKVKLSESKDVDQASDLLLNYSTLKDEKAGYIDRSQIRKAKHAAKLSKKKKAKESKYEKDIEMLKEVLGDLGEWQIRALYEANGCSFDRTVTAHTVANSRSNAPHVQSLVNKLEKPSIGPAHQNHSAPTRPHTREVDVITERERKSQALEAEIEKLESYKRIKQVPGMLISESQGRIATLKEELAELEVMAAHTMNSDQGNKIDFHNMTVKAALQVCEHRLEQWLSSPQERYLYLITGAGRHSANGVPLIKNALRKFLREKNHYTYRIQEDDGAFFLTKTLK